MKFRANRLFPVVLLFLWGCNHQERLVIYADPWVADYARDRMEHYQGSLRLTDFEFKVISSEVIVQHLRYGQPVDVVFCLGCAAMQQPDFRARVGEERPLANMQMVLAEQVDGKFTQKQAAMGCEDCLMMEASDRPTRRYLEASGLADSLSGDTLIANFQRQAADYLLRGWVPRGFVPDWFVRQHPERLRVAKAGPLIPNAFTAILISDAPQPDAARRFFDIATGKNSDQPLAELKFVP